MRGKVCGPAAAALLLIAGPAHAAGMDNMAMALVSVERLEYRVQDGSDVGFVEGDVTIGTDAHRLVLGIEAARELDEGKWEEAELQALYRRPVSEFFDVQAGIRHDFEPGTGATFLALGVTGLAPQFIELGAMGFVSTDGDVSLRVEAETGIFLTRRIFAVPLVEADLSASENASAGALRNWRPACGFITRSTAGLRPMWAYPTRHPSARPPISPAPPAGAGPPPPSSPGFGSASETRNPADRPPLSHPAPYPSGSTGGSMGSCVGERGVCVTGRPMGPRVKPEGLGGGGGEWGRPAHRRRPDRRFALAVRARPG